MRSNLSGMSSTTSSSVPTAATAQSTTTTAAAAPADGSPSLPDQIVERQRVQKANYGVLQALGASASGLFNAPSAAASTSSAAAAATSTSSSNNNSFLPPSSFHVPTVTQLSSVSPASTASAAPTPILVALSKSHLNTASPPLQGGAQLLLSPGAYAMLPPATIPTHSATAGGVAVASSSSSSSFASPLLPAAAVSSVAAASSTNQGNQHRARSASASPPASSVAATTNRPNVNNSAGTSGPGAISNASFVFEKFQQSSNAIESLKGTIAHLETILDEREANVKRLLEVELKLRGQLMQHSQEKIHGDKLIAELQQKMRADQQQYQENMKNANKTKEIDIHQWQATTEKYKNELHLVKDELTNVKRELTALKLEKSLAPSPTASLENMHAVAAAFLPSQNDILTLEARVKTAEETARTSKGELEMERKKFDKKLNKLLENRQQLVETNVEITNHCEQFEKALETLIQKNEIMEREKTDWQEQMNQKDQTIQKLTEQLKAKLEKQASKQQKQKEKEKAREITEESEVDADGIEDTPIGRAVNRRGRPRQKVTRAAAAPAASSSSPAAVAAADNVTAAESATIITAATPTRARKRKNAQNRDGDDEEEEMGPSDLEVLLQAQKEKELIQQQQHPNQAALIPRRRGRPPTAAAATSSSVRMSPRLPPAAFAAAAAASNAAHASNAIISPVATAIMSPALAAIASPLGPTPMSPQLAATGGSSSSSRSLIAAAPINTPLMALTVKTRRGRPPKNPSAPTTSGNRQLRPTISNLNTAPVPPPTFANVTAVNIMQPSIAATATLAIAAKVKQPAKKRARTAAAVASQSLPPLQQTASEMELELFGEVSEENSVDPFAATIKSIASNWISSFDIIDEQMSEQGVVAFSHPIDQLLPMLCKNIHRSDAPEAVASPSTILCSNAIPRVFSSLFTQLVSQLIDRTGGSAMEPIFLSLKASNKVQLLVAQFIRACHWMTSQLHDPVSIDDEPYAHCSCLPDGDFHLMDALSDLCYQSLLARKNDHALSISQAAVDCAHLTFLMLSAPDSVQVTKTSFIVGASVVTSVAHLLSQLLAGRLLAPLHLLQHFLCLLSTASNAAELKKLHPFHREVNFDPIPHVCEHITSELSKLSASHVWHRVFDASGPDGLLPAPQLCSACCHSRPILSRVCHTICRKLLQPYLSQSLQMRCPQLVHFVTSHPSENDKPDQLLSSVMLQIHTYEKAMPVEVGGENRLSQLLTSWSLLMSSVGPNAALLIASEVCIPLYEEARADSNQVQAHLWQKAIGIVADLHR